LKKGVGKAECPFKDLTVKEARQAAKDVMMEFKEGGTDTSLADLVAAKL